MVTKQTAVLVCRHYTKSLVHTSEYMVKGQTACEMIDNGQDILILSQAVFYEVAVEQLQQA